MQILAVISSSLCLLLPKMLIGNNDKIIISNIICTFDVWLHLPQNIQISNFCEFCGEQIEIFSNWNICCSAFRGATL